MDHRKYVGGNWEEAGKKQIDFLKEEGLQPYHKFLDIGCGSLRAGVHFIDYLDPGNYHGVEKHQWLLDAGVEKEMDKNQRRNRPNLVHTDNFDFSSFKERKFDYVIAKSVFTHLVKDKIKECLDNLLPVMNADGKFYASISMGDSKNNPTEDSETKRFSYIIDEIKELATGWNVTLVGKNGCFRQSMLKFVPIKQNIKVSIVTAAFRAENMGAVVASIMRQSFEDFEWIIVNDGQKEIREWYRLGKDYLLEQGIDVSFVDVEETRGRFGLYSRNIGAMIAKYDRIVFLDDDNEWTPEHLQSMVEAEMTTGKIPYCWMRLIGKKPESTYNRIKQTHFGRQGIDLGCLLYRKDHFIKYGYFQDTRQVTYDFDFMHKIFDGEGTENFICTNKPTFIFHHKRY